MAARIVNRKERRAEVEAAEKRGKTAKKTEAKATTKKEPAQGISRAMSRKDVRLKRDCVVFD